MLRKLKEFRFEYIGVIVVLLILSPVLFVTFRDGIGSAVFSVHDQLDETILNYVFSARYFGADTYEQMMCGIPSVSLQPFCPGFVPLYMLFDVYTAFLLQYIIVVLTAFYGMYFCVRKITGNSFAAFLTATLFAMLPVHSIYGNIVMGTPLLLVCILVLRDAIEKPSSKKTSVKAHLKIIISTLGIIYYGLTTGFALSGWAVLGLLTVAIAVEWIIAKKFPKYLLIPFGLLLTIFVSFNLGLVSEAFAGGGFVSHRTEYSLNQNGTNFFMALKDYLFDQRFNYEAQTMHLWIYPTVVIAFILLLIGAKKKNADERMKVCLKQLVIVLCSLFALIITCSFLGSGVFAQFKSMLPGMFSSFQFARLYYFLPAMWYLALGVSLNAILVFFEKKGKAFAVILPCVFSALLLLFFVKDKDSIFFQNRNQANNGSAITGYITMKSLYSEDLMELLDEEIGEDKSSYRIAHIGMCPVASLMHGFYTVDGYSNNYPLEYKHRFRKVIAGELEANDYIKAYFDEWGNRCYIFYHEWGDYYMAGKNFNGVITDLRVDIDELKSLNCKYIFSAAEIDNPEQHGLIFRGEFVTETSYWKVRLYEIDY